MLFVSFILHWLGRFFLEYQKQMGFALDLYYHAFGLG